MQVNLARKWRPRRFEDLVGQPLVVRTFKNSLYKEILFPVYLLTGTRGCGKTSAARIFAAALNCDAYEQFKKDPQNVVVPCLTCYSCTAMTQLNHPDFIEIDAASHTGVDNIRQISEAASFIPSISKKKIYLIDEAHMLSKAAFNAFLKLLEEPPATVCFMLATTEINKIPQTVKSRCLQLFFYPIEQEALVQHLIYVCNHESIKFELEALGYIASESEGSVRDALNLVERVRLVSPYISVDATIRVLGILGNQHLITLIHSLFRQDERALFSQLDEQLASINSSAYFWRRLSQLFSFLLAYKQEIRAAQSSEFYPLIDQELQDILASYPLSLLSDWIDIIIYYEAMLVKSAQWQLVVKAFFMKLLQRITKSKLTTPHMHGSSKKSLNDTSAQEQVPQSLQKTDHKKNISSYVDNRHKKSSPDVWLQFLRLLEQLNEFLVSSIFAQTKQLVQRENTLELIFEEHLAFYKECLDNSQQTWQPLLDKVYGKSVQLKLTFTQHAQPNTWSNKPNHSRQSGMGNALVSRQEYKLSRTVTSVNKQSKYGRRLQVTTQNKAVYQKSSLLLDFFPGTITISDKQIES